MAHSRAVCFDFFNCIVWGSLLYCLGFFMVLFWVPYCVVSLFCF